MCCKAIFRWFICLLCLASGMVAGCAGIPEGEYASFTPKQSHERNMNQIKVSWEVRDDAESYCKQRQLDKGVSIKGTHVACAVWSVQHQTCRIVTGAQVSHVVLGHELRHCFEGHFHN